MVCKIRILVTICGGITSASYIWSQKESKNAIFFNHKISSKMKIIAEEDYKEKLKVLIVGAGLTGCLTSYLLNKELGDHIDLHILEKSPYPSGRFGAGLRYKNEIKGSFKWCDMGSQVLSALDCEGDHPNACSSGHGMYSKDLFAAWELVKLLNQANVISRAPVNSEDNEKNPLDPTEERMIFDNLWAHFWPTSNKVNRNGLSGVLSYILKKAAPLNIEFNRKVQFLHYNGEKFIVYSTLNGNESDVMEFSDIGDVTKRKDKCLHMDMADIVIVTLPSVQTKNLAGHFLPDFVNKDLGNIQYENRASCSFVARMSPELAMKACLLFGPEKTELNLELNDIIPSQSNEKIHLIIWQDRKNESYESLKSSVHEKLNSSNLNDETIELSFTFHSTVASFNSFDSSKDFETYAQDCLRSLLKDHTNKLQIVKSRGVLWPYSQPSAPMETLYAEVEDLEKAYPYGPAYVDSAGLVLAGDYFTQSSYVGCFCSAAAATRALSDIIKEREKTPELENPQPT